MYFTKFIITVIAVLLFIVACNGDSTNQTANDANDRFSHAMRHTPMNASSFILIDLYAFRTNEDLQSLYEDEELHDYTEFMSPLGIQLDQLQYIAAFDLPMHSVGMFTAGSIDSNQVNSALKELGFVPIEYNGVETWEGYFLPPEQVWPIEKVALIDALVVMGQKQAVDTALDVVIDNSPSLNDNDASLDIVDRLPQGAMVVLTNGAFWPAGKIYAGQESMGMATIAEDSITLQSVTIWKFNSESAAIDATSVIERDIREEAYFEHNYTMSVSRDKHYITVIIDDDLSSPIGQ